MIWYDMIWYSSICSIYCIKQIYIYMHTSIKTVFVTCFFLSNVSLQYECVITCTCDYIPVHYLLFPLTECISVLPKWEVQLKVSFRFAERPLCEIGWLDMTPGCHQSLFCRCINFFVNNISSDNQSNRIQTEATTHFNQTLCIMTGGARCFKKQSLLSDLKLWAHEKLSALDALGGALHLLSHFFVWKIVSLFDEVTMNDFHDLPMKQECTRRFFRKDAVASESWSGRVVVAIGTQWHYIACMTYE